MSQAAERWDLSYTQNRELSWLAFDQRVLEEAADPSVPLMERLRFLSIFTSNLDEFFMVRVGSLTDLALVAPNARENKGGFSPAEQLRRIYAAVVPLVRQRDQVYRELIEALAEHGVADIPYKELKNGEREYVRAWYREAMRPLLMPQIIDPSHPFPHLKNKTLYAAALLREGDKRRLGIVGVPDVVPPILPLPARPGAFVRTEDILAHHLRKIFKIYQIEEQAVVSVTRNADISYDEAMDQEDLDLRAQMTKLLRQRERLVRMAHEVGVPCEICWFTAQERTALDRLERCFFGSDEVWPEPTEQIALYEAATAYSEAEYVAAQIREMVRSGKYRYRDIAVAARNMDRYGPILENALRRAEIPAYQARRHDILEKSVITLLLGAVDAVTGGLEYEDMFRYLKTGLAGITPAECDLLENYVILWQIRGSMWLRETPWTANPDGYGAEMTDARQARLDEINRIREKVRGPLTQLSDGLKTCRTARGKAEALYTFAQRSGAAQTLQQQATEQMACGEVQLAEESAQLWQIFCDVLDQFVEILGGQEIGGEEFARLLRLVLTQYSVGTIPATLDQVRVSEITRNDRHRVKCLFLLGAGDDVLPTVERRGGVLDDEDRETIQQHDIELSNVRRAG